MGLAGRKVKQRIGADPRNLAWANDASKFGQNYLAKFGWDSTQGLGVAGDGRTSHIKVAQKLDMFGIGAAQQQDPNGIAWKQNKDFERLLQRLNEEKTSEPPRSDNEVKTQNKSARRRPHRARAIAAKNTKSAAAISEILGLASAPTTQGTSQVLTVEPDAQISTSTKSVADYFKERLQAKVSTPQKPLEDESDDDTPRTGLGLRKDSVEQVKKQDDSDDTSRAETKDKKRKKKIDKDERKRKKRRKSRDEDS